MLYILLHTYSYTHTYTSFLYTHLYTVCRLRSNGDSDTGQLLYIPRYVYLLIII